MNTGFVRCAVGATLGIAGSAAPADGLQEHGWFASSGWFLEASVLDVDSSGGPAPFAFDDEESGAVIGGGYSFNRHLALQASYYRLGEHFATDCPDPLVCTAIVHGDRVDVEGLAISALGTWRVTPSLELFGKIGVLGWDAGFQRTLRSESDRDMLYGAGVGIWLSPRWRLNVQYERVDFDLESAGLGATFRF